MRPKYIWGIYYNVIIVNAGQNEWWLGLTVPAQRGQTQVQAKYHFSSINLLTSQACLGYICGVYELHLT